MKRKTNPENFASLRSSPLFNLSLGSKELFHSNFLLWVCEQYPNEFGQILAQRYKIYNQSLPNTIVTPKREDRNIDLSFTLNGVKFLIENKVKSVPDKRQLEMYAEQFVGERRLILLSIIKPNFDIEETDWELMLYEDLAELLRELLVLACNTSHYLKLLISDYICFIQNLSAVIRSLENLSIGESFCFYNDDFQLFHEIRLHDLYIKNRYSQLLSQLQEFLTARDIENVVIDERYQGRTGSLVLSFNLVNAKGVVNVDYPVTPGMTLGIMLDGLKFIHYIHTHVESGFITREIAQSLRDKRLWFCFDDVPEESSYPRKGKAFNKFGGLLYRSVKINAEVSIEQVFDKIYLDVKKLIEISKMDLNSI